MPDLAHPLHRPEDLSSVVLLESAQGAELHLRSANGAWLRVPLGGAGHRRSLAALAMIAGTPGVAAHRRRSRPPSVFRSVPPSA